MRHPLQPLSELFHDHPDPTEAVPVVEAGAPAPLARGQSLSLVTWNIQFAAGRHHFFYDGGPTVRVSPAQVESVLTGIGSVIAEDDLVLLQEVDRGADRTGRIDELAAFVAEGRWARWLSARYHRARFVPHPWPRFLGKVEMHLCTLSRFELGPGVRTQLPLMREPWLRQQFNLRRCLLTTTIPLIGGGVLHVANTHLSAFTNGDGTLPAQIQVLANWMAEREARGESFVLAGDLNALPPDDDPARLGAMAVEYQDATPPIKQLIPRFRSALSPEQLRDPRCFTFLPPHAMTPDRVLDYVFVSRDLQVADVAVVPCPSLSDHLPIRIRLTVP